MSHVAASTSEPGTLHEITAVQHMAPSMGAQTVRDAGNPERALIMIVDDESMVIDATQIFLEDAGYCQFVSTTRSPEALAVLARERPDILLLDINMPEVNGFDILEKVRANAELSRLPVIVLTATSDSNTKLKALELGATDFLAKPVDASELVLRVRNTLAAKAHQDRLTYSDPLTGLLNRLGFVRSLAQELRRSRRGALLDIDLDRFAKVNQALGPGIGDLLLQAVAQRLQQYLRTSVERGSVGLVDHEATAPKLARLGSDEFMILLPHVADTTDAVRLAERLVGAFGAPFSVVGHELYVTLSIGITIFPDDHADVDGLMKRSGVAVHYVAERGGNAYLRYNTNLDRESISKLSLEADLRRAFDRGELLLHYQPKLHVVSGALSGMEALVRWQHPRQGLLGPSEFISMAEEVGLIEPLGEWVLRSVCAQITRWKTAGLDVPRVSVNLSSLQFRRPDLSNFLYEITRSMALRPSELCLELTESMVMENPRDNARVLEELDEAGFKLSIDDFGTGYSSLSYLKSFPLEELKIDRSFVIEIGNSASGRALVVGIINLAHALGLRVVAEGVETDRQLEFLLAHGCDEYQGFLFSRPVSGDQLAKFLRASAPASAAIQRASVEG